MNTPAATLWFLAPGLAHQLGNAVFTVHGRARLLTTAPANAGMAASDDPGSTAADDARAILEGIERAQVGLTVLRWLSEDHADAQRVDRVLTALVDVARVPLRDHGLQLELAGDRGPPALVDPVQVCRGLGAAFRAVAHELDGVHARLSLSHRVEDQTVHLICRVQARQGQPALPPWAQSAAESLGGPVRSGQGGETNGPAEEPSVHWESADQGAVLVGIIPVVGATFRTS